MFHDQYYVNTVISISSVQCTNDIEFFYKEAITSLYLLPRNLFVSNISLLISTITEQISFVRSNETGWQLQKNIIFLDVKIAMDHQFRPHSTVMTKLPW